MTVTPISKITASVSGIDKSMDYTINDLADYEIQDLDFTFENQTVPVVNITKNNATITGISK